MAVAETDLETSRAFAVTATAGQRVVAAAVVSVPFASLVGATTAVAVDLAAGVVTGALVLVGLVAYVARFLAGEDAVGPSPARRLAALAAADPPGGQACAVCGAWFDAVRPNQRYCCPDCRRRAAASRRRAARR